MRLAIKSSRGGNVLCVDWDERMLRVLDAVTSRSGVKVRTAVYVPIPQEITTHDAEGFGQFIKRTLAEHRIRTRRAVVNVPRQDAVLNLVMLPAGSADELASMVHIQAAKELPFGKDEAVLDFAVKRIEDSSQCEVWVSAVRNQVVDHHRRVFAAAGLRLERIGLRPNANLLALTAEGAPDGRTLLVDVGSSMTEITILRQGRLAYSRAASVSVPLSGLKSPLDASGVDETSADESSEQVLNMRSFEQRRTALDALLVEVGRTVEAYRATDPGAQIDRIVLAGLAGTDRKVATAFERRFNASTTAYVPPAQLEWRSSDEHTRGMFNACIGLSLGNLKEGLDHFDFLHPTEPEAERRERAKRVPWFAAAGVLLTAGLIYAAYYPISSLKSRHADIKAEIEEIEGDKDAQKKRKKFNDEFETLQTWTETSVPILDPLTELAKVFPPNEKAFVTDLRYDDKGVIYLELAAVDESVAIELAKRINDITAPVEDEKAGKTTAKAGKSEAADADESAEPATAPAEGEDAAEPEPPGDSNEAAENEADSKDKKKGEPLFVATTGRPGERRDDNHYRVKDEIEVKILSIAE